VESYEIVYAAEGRLAGRLSKRQSTEAELGLCCCQSVLTSF
jgi:hypothetical protein